jgi:hypothetical protein
MSDANPFGRWRREMDERISTPLREHADDTSFGR